MSLCSRSAAEIARAIREGEFSVRQVVESFLEVIESKEPMVNALLTLTRVEAFSRAQFLDEALARGEDIGPLGGVPVIVKDNMCTEGIRTTCGSKILEDWVPPYDASVVRFLEEAGAVIMGKANMDEFAMGSSTEHSAYMVTSNPWDFTRVPGGSSGGSAAAAAAGYAPLTLGSDTGGSIRQPGAFCGVYGFKPTYGLVSRFGLVAYASSLDQIGPFARTVEDLALCLNVISKADPKDGTCSHRDRPDFLESLKTEDMKGKKVGLVREFSEYEIDPEIQSAMDRTHKVLEDLGAEVVEVSLPTIGYVLPAYYIIAPAEASSNLARFDGVRYGLSEDAESLMDLYLRTRGHGFGPEVKRRILTGTYVLSSGYYDAYYNRALKVKKVVTREFDKAFEEVDLLLIPASPTLPFKKGENMDDPLKMYMTDVFTLPMNIAGLPGLSINTGYTESGLPLGVQLVGPRWGEMAILGAANALEKVFGVPRIAGGAC